MKAPILALLIASTACAAQAQVYRIVGPDGKVTFSDKPPATPEQGKVTATGVGASGAASTSSLPYELRQVASRYPVTLYSSSDCSPCALGRSLLVARGIPFTERTVNTPEDLAALTRIGGDNSLPLLTIGGQKVRGFSNGEWGQYLDLAGYPKTSALPSAYRNAPATPLVSTQPAVAAKPRDEAPTLSAPPPPSGPTATNPAGIQF